MLLFSNSKQAVSKRRVMHFLVLGLTVLGTLSQLCAQTDAQKIDRVSQDRIANITEQIKQDFVLLKRKRQLTGLGRAALVLVVFAASYKWWSSLHLTEKEQLMIQQVREKISQEAQQAILDSQTKDQHIGRPSGWLSKMPVPSSVSGAVSGWADYLKRGKVPIEAGVNIPVKQLGEHDSLISRFGNKVSSTTKEYGSWAFGILSTSAVNWLGTSAMTAADNHFSAIDAERSIGWFVQHKTHLDAIMEQMKYLAFLLEPNTSLVGEISLGKGVAVDEDELLQELVRLKLLAYVTPEGVTGEEKKEYYVNKLLTLGQRWVYDIERVIAFVRVCYPEDTYAEHLLIRESNQLSDILESFGQKSDGEKKSLLVNGVFKAWLQLNHVISHLLFESKVSNVV